MMKNPDWGFELREIVVATDKLHPVFSILNDHLGMTKLSIRWVPSMLTIDHQLQRLTMWKKFLALSNSNPVEFCSVS